MFAALAVCLAVGQAQLPAIGPGFITYQTLCRRLAAPDRPVSCAQAVSCRMAAVRLMPGSWERDIDVLGKVLGVQFIPQAAGGFQMIADPARAAAEAKLRDAESQMTFVALRKEAQTAWRSILEHQGQSPEQFHTSLEPEARNGQSRSDGTDNPIQAVFRNPITALLYRELAQDRSFDEWVSGGDRLLLNSDDVSDSDWLIRIAFAAGAYVVINPTSRINLAPSTALSTLGGNETLDLGIGFDPASGGFVCGGAIRYGPRSGNYATIRWIPNTELDLPGLSALEGAAGQGKVAAERQAVTTAFLKSDLASKTVQIPAVTSYGKRLLSWAASTDTELIAEVSPVRDSIHWNFGSDAMFSLRDLMRYHEDLGRDFGKASPVGSQSAALYDGVVGVRDEWSFIDQLRWPKILEPRVEELLADETPKTLDRWIEEARSFDRRAVGRAASCPLFDRETGAVSFYPVLALLGRLPAERILHGDSVALPLRSFRDARLGFLASARAVSQGYYGGDLFINVANIGAIMQPDLEDVLPDGTLQLTWHQEAGEIWSLNATITVPADDPHDISPFHPEGFKSSTIWEATLYGLTRS